MGAGLVTGSTKTCPVYVIDLKDFEKLTHFPRHSDPVCSRKLRNVNTLDLSNTLVVFISHLWHRDPKESHSRPDNKNNDAFSLCKAGLRQLHDQHAALLPKCVVWVDYCCVQNPEWVNSAKHRKRLKRQAAALQKQKRRGSITTNLSIPGINKDAAPPLTYQHLRLDAILTYCDCMFTPVVSKEAWRALAVSLACVLPDQVEGWNKTPACYMNRAWCRLEMFLCANLPLSSHTIKKGKWFGSELGSAIHASRRPHFLFGPPDFQSTSSPTPLNGSVPPSQQVAMQLPPQCLPPLQNSHFFQLHPLRGAFSNPSDRPLLRLLCDRLQRHLPNPPLLARRMSSSMINSSLKRRDSMSTSKSGKRNLLGQVTDSNGSVVFGSGDRYQGGMRGGVMQGYGQYVHVEGDIYKGMFVNNEMSGVGTYTHADGDKYSGEWLRGLKHGTGTLTFANGGEYRGQWRWGLIHGKGRYTYKSGDIYEGNRVDGVITGHGVMTCVNGDRYCGEYLRGKRHGQGKFEYADGSVYEGRWVAGVIHGFGELKSCEGWTYRGMWLNEMPDGEGVFCYKGGDRYRGGVSNGRREGHGELLYASGDRYIGPFVRDLREGEEGTLVTLPGNTKKGIGSTYKGSFLQNLFSGEGQLTFTDGETFVGTFHAGQRLHGESRKSDGSVYVGEFCNDMRGGHGVFTYKSGSRYEGGWKDGQKHGGGTLASHNGDFYRGHFAKNKFHGYGVMTTHKGEEYRGRWRNGMRDGKGQCSYKSGDHFSGLWKKNKRLKGTMRRWTGEVYEGEYDENGQQSSGRYTYLSGNGYVGEWKGNDRSGRGRMYMVNKKNSTTKTTIKTAEWSGDFAYRTLDVISYDPPSSSEEEEEEEEEEHEDDDENVDDEAEDDEGDGGGLQSEPDLVSDVVK